MLKKNTLQIKFSKEVEHFQKIVNKKKNFQAYISSHNTHTHISWISLRLAHGTLRHQLCTHQNCIHNIIKP